MKSFQSFTFCLVVGLVGSFSLQAAAQNEQKSENPLIESIARIKRILSEDSYWLRHAQDPASDRMVRDILVEDLIRKIKQLREIESVKVDVRHLEELVSDNEICSSLEEMIDPATSKSALEMVREELEGKKQELNRLLSQIDRSIESRASPTASSQRIRAYGLVEPLPLGDY